MSDPLGFRVAFYGDSIVTGWRGISSPNRRWTSIVSKSLGWEEVNIARNGVGFVRRRGEDRADDGMPLGLLGEVLNSRTDLVVVALGGNDSVIVNDRYDDIQSAIVRDLRMLVDMFGQCRVVVLDLYSPHGEEKPPGWIAVRAFLKAATTDAGLLWLSGLDSAIGGDSALLCSDHVHPNDEGHAALARSIVGVLAPLAPPIN